MKGKLSRMLRSGLSLMLVFCMLISMAPAAFAVETEEAPAAKEHINYVSIGDSMANGYGFVGYKQNSSNRADYDIMTGKGMYGVDAYPLQFEEYLTEELGYDVNHTKLATSAMMAEDLIWLLGGIDEHINDGWNGYRDYASGYSDDELKPYFQNAVKNADIITMGIGNASFGAFMMDRVTTALGVFGAEMDPDDPVLNFEKAIAGLNMDEEQYGLVMDMYNHMKGELTMPPEYAEEYDMEAVLNIVAYTAASYIVHYKMVINRIIELNPNVEIVLVGLMNTTYGMNITDENGEVLVAFGDMMDENFAMLNAYMAALPAILQAQGKAGEAEFYYAEQPTPKFICQAFEELHENDWVYHDERLDGTTVRERNIDAYNDNLRNMIAMAFSGDGFELSLPKICLADVQAYEANPPSWVCADWGYGFIPNGFGPVDTSADEKNLSVAIYLAIEGAVAKNTNTMDIPEQSLKIISTDIGSVFTDVDYKVDAAGTSPDGMREYLEAYLTSTPVLCGMCKIYGLFKVGNGMSVHPTPEGHDDIIVAVKNAYANGDPEKSNTVAKEYVEILKGMSDDASLAMEIYNYLGANDKITDKQTVVIMHAAMGLNEEIGDDTMALLKLCYATIMDVDNYYISDLSYEDRLEIIGGIYNILKGENPEEGYLKDYADKLPLLEAIVNMDSLQNVSAKTRFEIVDGLFNDIMNGEQIDTNAVLNNCYDSIMIQENLPYAERLAIIVELYNILKTDKPEEGYLSDYVKEMKMLEDILALPGMDKVSDETYFGIFNETYNRFMDEDGFTEDDAMTVLDLCYEGILNGGTPELSKAERLEIMGGIYKILKANGYLADYAADLPLLEAIVNMDALESVSDDTRLLIVDKIYNQLNGGELSDAAAKGILEYCYNSIMYNASADGDAMTAEERLAIVVDVYKTLKENKKLEGYDLAVLEAIVSMDSLQKVSAETRFAIVDFIFYKAMNDDLDDAAVKQILEYCYNNIMLYEELPYEERLAIVVELYNVLKEHGMLADYAAELPLLEAIVSMDSLQKVSAETRFYVVDSIYMELMSGELDEEAAKNLLFNTYASIMYDDGLAYEDRLAIFVELYNVLKEYGKLDSYKDNLPLLEAIVSMPSLQKVSAQNRFDLIDYVFQHVMNNGLNDESAEFILVNCYYHILLADGLAYEDRLAIIVELYNVLKEQGMLADYEADLSVLEEILALPELEAVSAEKKFDLVDTIFNLVMSSEGELGINEIRELIGYIWFTTLDVGGAEEQTVFARFAARIAGSDLSVEEKIAIVGAVLAVLNDGTAQIDAIETLFNDLTALDEENDQYVPDDVLNELFDEIMKKVADPSVDLTDSAVTTALAADMATTILTDNRIKTENRPYIVEAIAKALAAIGGEDVVGDVAGEDAEEALEVIVALRDALAAADYLSDAQQGEILEEIGAVLPDAMAGNLSQEDMLAIAEKVYNIVYNRDNLSAEQKLAILNIIYGVLEERGYVSKEEMTDPENIKIALEELYKLMEQYGPTAAEQVWKIWEKYGYVDLVNASVAELKAVLEARYAYYTETALPAIDASIAALNAQKANLEADLAVLKAELEAVLAEQEIGSVHTPDINLDVEIGNNEQTIVPDHECESDGTVEGEKAAAIADLEHAIAVLEALIADIDADIADMTALAEQIAANVVELGKTISDLVAAGEDVAAAVAAISAVLASDNGADAYYAACATAKAALEVLEVANAAANELAADVDVLMDMLLADAQALNKLIADTQNDILAELAQDEVIMQGVGASLIMYKLVMDNQDVIQLIAEQEIAKLQAEADAKLAPLMEELSGLEAELADLEAELAAKLPELEAKQAELEEAIKAEAEEAVKAALEAELAALQGEIEKIEAAMATAQAQIERVNSDMATIKADLEHAIGHLMNAATAEMLNQLNSALNDLAKILAEKGLEAVNDIIDAIIELVKPLIVEATTEDYVITKDSYYVALGDGSAVSNSYVDRVAGELGIPFANLSVDGQTLANAPAYIEANAAEIAKADLITLGYGNNAFAKKAIDRAYAAMSGKTYESYDWTVMVGADGAAYVAQALADIKVELVANGMDTAFGKTTLADATVLAMEAYAYHAMEYVMNLPAAIAAVREVNPNAVVLIVGMYNPLEDSTLAFGESAIAVGEYLDYLVTGADVYGIAYCILFDNANYVSAPDAETEAANREHNLIGFLTEYMVAGDEVMNPNAEGHEYIKTKILNALNITVKPGTFYKKFMQGFDATTFRPQNNITRAQAAKMFANILDESYKANYKFAGKFSDIPENFWAAKELEILSDMGVILGFEDGTFRPNAPITRGQFAAMAVRFVDATIEGTENFSDIDQNTWCYDYVRTAVANGWIDGYEDGTYRPQGKITRAAAAKIACGMLDRPMDEAFFDAQVEAGAMKALDDTVGTWAYYWILSATNSFVY